MGKRINLRAVLLLLLMVQAERGVGQAGRKPPPQPPPAVVKTEPTFAPDPNRGEYQLIYSKISEAEKRSLSRKLSSWERREHHAASFSDDLTHVGEQGYRLASIGLSPRLAVMRRTDHQYEYAVVQIASRKSFFPNDPEFERTFAPWARKGFRIADYIVLSDYCEMRSDDPINTPNDLRVDCTYYSQMVLERRKNADIMPPSSYRTVYARPTYSKAKLKTGLLEELDNARKTNLHPTHMLTRFQLLTQSGLGIKDLLGDEYETEVLNGDVRKRVNELSQLGYRLILRPHLYEAGVMHRKKGATDPTSYVWLGEKSVEQELPRLAEQGAIYRMNYGCATYAYTHLIVEQPSVSDGKRREYKVLPIELKETDADFSSGSNSIIREFNRLTKEGFEPRAFFACALSDKKEKPSRAKLLLERVSNKNNLLGWQLNSERITR
jgi:hypothetical protein